MRRSAAMTVFSCGLMALSGSSACQDYSDKPVRIVTAAPGGNGDFASRLIAPALTQRLGKQVIVDDRTRGVVLGEIVSKAPPDGHTLLAYEHRG